MPDDAVIRLLCHAILERLPHEALDGVWELLNDTWEWYRRPVLPAPPVEQPSFLLGRVFDPVDEEPFSLTEE